MLDFSVNLVISWSCAAVDKLSHGPACVFVLFPFDPHPDPHGETSGWKQWRQERDRPADSEPKVPETSANKRLKGYLHSL